MRPDSPFFDNCIRGLRRSPLFAGLQEEYLEEMLRLCTRRTSTCGSRLFGEQNVLRFHIILSGRIEVIRSHPDTGRSITLWLLGPGDGFDIITLLDGEIHDVVPVVLDDIELLTVPLDTMRQWMIDHPDFNRCFLPYMGELMRRMEDLSSSLALHDTITRLASLILHYINFDGLSTVDDRYPVALINDLTHDSLASMVGSVRTVVNRHLQHLKKEGVVEFHRGFLAVKNLEKLASHAGKTLHELNRQHQKKP